MNIRFSLRSLLALSMALALATVAVGAVSAEKGKGGPGTRPGPGGRHIVLHGVIAAIDGDLITLRQADGSEVGFTLDEQTRIVPPGATPQVGMKAQVVARKPKVEGEQLVAVSLVLVDRPGSPGEPRLGPPVHGCGIIEALPEVADPAAGGWLGQWVISAPGVAQYSLLVTAETRMAPPDVTPAVGAQACFTARQGQDGLVAQSIQLATPGRDDARKGKERLVVLRGTVATLPEHLTPPWTLDVAVLGAGSVAVTVTEDTEIRGELAVGAPVLVHARRATDESGSELLMALKVCVCGERCREESPL